MIDQPFGLSKIQMASLRTAAGVAMSAEVSDLGYEDRRRGCSGAFTRHVLAAFELELTALDKNLAKKVAQAFAKAA